MLVLSAPTRGGRDGQAESTQVAGHAPIRSPIPTLTGLEVE